MTSHNPRFRRLALEIGPLTPSRWPLHAFSGTTGAEPNADGVHAYGWRHDHLLTPALLPWWLQCYAARPAYYEGEPLRRSGYGEGCRPKAWKPETHDDALGGEWLGPTPWHVAVSGPDIEHFPLSPLLAIADNGTPYAQGLTSWSDEAAADKARIMLRFLGAAHAGMVRTEGGGVSAWVCSHRSASYFLRTLVDLGKRGLLDQADALTLLAYVELTLLPSWLGPISGQSGGKGGPGQVYNGVYWLLPALHDLAVATPPGLLRRRLADARDLMARQVSWLEALVPGRGCQVEKVATWDYSLTAAWITTQPYWGPWGVRAMHVAGTVLGSERCLIAAQTEADKWADDPSAKAWLVDASGEWMV